MPNGRSIWLVVAAPRRRFARLVGSSRHSPLDYIVDDRHHPVERIYSISHQTEALAFDRMAGVVDRNCAEAVFVVASKADEIRSHLGVDLGCVAYGSALLLVKL